MVFALLSLAIQKFLTFKRLETQYIYQDGKLIASLLQWYIHFYLDWSGAEIKCTEQNFLPKRRIKQFKPVQQSRLSYYIYIYIYIYILCFSSRLERIYFRAMFPGREPTIVLINPELALIQPSAGFLKLSGPILEQRNVLTHQVLNQFLGILSSKK